MRVGLVIAFVGFTLTACSFGGPSKSDVALAVGAPENYVTDLSCGRAENAPGYVCSFVIKTPTTGYGIFERGQTMNLTRRFVRSDSGKWNVF